MRLGAWGIAAAWALAACASAPKEVTGPPVRAALEEEFRIGAREVAVVGSDGLRIRFIGVTEDSRCPINARCIRAGAAKVELELSAPGTRTVRAILSTPDDPRGASFGPYEVEALEVQPGREIGAPTPRYEAALRVRRRARPAP